MKHSMFSVLKYDAKKGYYYFTLSRNYLSKISPDLNKSLKYTNSDFKNCAQYQAAMYVYATREDEDTHYTERTILEAYDVFKKTYDSKKKKAFIVKMFYELSHTSAVDITKSNNFNAISSCGSHYDTAEEYTSNTCNAFDQANNGDRNNGDMFTMEEVEDEFLLDEITVLGAPLSSLLHGKHLRTIIEDMGYETSTRRQETKACGPWGAKRAQLDSHAQENG